MRLALTIAAVLVLAGCGAPIRTAAAPGPDGIASPVYEATPQAVLAACVRACDAYCHNKPDLVDEAAGKLHVCDTNGWTGSVLLTAEVVAIDPAHTRLDLAAEFAGDVISLGGTLRQTRLRGFIDHVSADLRATVDQAPVAAGNGASATSTP